MRFKQLLRRLIHSATPYTVVAQQKTGYKILINDSTVYRYEKRWSDANRITRKLQRQGVEAHFRRMDGRNTRRELNQAKAA
jgi:hypothetical protein